MTTITEMKRPGRPRGPKEKRPRKSPATNIAKTSPPKRNRGRPTRDKTPFTPDTLKQIAELWLRGEPLQRIADQFSVSANGIRYHLQKTVIPSWRDGLRDSATVALERIRYTGQVALSRWLENPEDGVSSRVFMWALDRECRILGHDSPKKIQIDAASYRAAGKSREALTDEMMARLVKKMAELRQRGQIAPPSCHDNGVATAAGH